MPLPRRWTLRPYFSGGAGQELSGAESALIYYYYFNQLKFAKVNDADNRIGEEFELALSVMSRKPWSLKYFDVDRVGLAIRTSKDVVGVSLITSLPF